MLERSQIAVLLVLHSCFIYIFRKNVFLWLHHKTKHINCNCFLNWYGMKICFEWISYFFAELIQRKETFVHSYFRHNSILLLLLRNFLFFYKDNLVNFSFQKWCKFRGMANSLRFIPYLHQETMKSAFFTWGNPIEKKLGLKRLNHLNLS